MRVVREKLLYNHHWPLAVLERCFKLLKIICPDLNRNGLTPCFLFRFYLKYIRVFKAFYQNEVQGQFNWIKMNNTSDINLTSKLVAMASCSSCEVPCVPVFFLIWSNVRASFLFYVICIISWLSSVLRVFVKHIVKNVLARLLLQHSQRFSYETAELLICVGVSQREKLYYYLVKKKQEKRLRGKHAFAVPLSEVSSYWNDLQTASWEIPFQYDLC